MARSLPQIFSDDRRAALRARYRIIETTDEDLPALPDAALRCIFNV